VKFHQLRAFFSYWLTAVDEHSLHSPFLYELYTKVIKRDNNFMQNTLIEEIREILLFDDQVIEFNDFGTGSNGQQPIRRRVQQIARRCLAPQRFARLYQRLAQYFKSEKTIELGTSFGITSMYLANYKGAKVSTFEGASEIAAIARRNFKYLDSPNLELITGNLAETLPAFLSSTAKIDLVLMDANHRFEPTMKYFHWLLPRLHTNSILIMDDIHLSPQMESAWHQVRHNSAVHGSIDLFRCGIVFFNPSLNKQHVVLQLN
jgi:predicted O-methyltransferase YrrM